MSNAQKNEISALLSTNTIRNPVQTPRDVHILSAPTSSTRATHVNDGTWNTAAQSTQQASKSVLGGSVIHGGVFNISIVKFRSK